MPSDLPRPVRRQKLQLLHSGKTKKRDRLGLGFPFLSRGWWARFFVFPEWWGIFSLYVTTALVTLAVSFVPLGGTIVARLLMSREKKSRPKKPRRETAQKKHPARPHAHRLEIHSPSENAPQAPEHPARPHAHKLEIHSPSENESGGSAHIVNV